MRLRGRREHLFILNGKRPEACGDTLKWGRWFETADRRVALTKVGEHFEVSTVFLGLDHSFSGTGPPILFETMAFGPEQQAPKGAGPMSGRIYREDMSMARYATWEEAEAGHALIVKECEAAAAELQEGVRAALEKIRGKVGEKK